MKKKPPKYLKVNYESYHLIIKLEDDHISEDGRYIYKVLCNYYAWNIGDNYYVHDLEQKIQDKYFDILTEEEVMLELL